MDGNQGPGQPERADEGLGQAWDQHRPYLLDLAFRVLGNINDAEDMVQEAFIRLLRADTADIEDVRGWLIVVVTRLCLDQLRSARSHREVYTESPGPDLWTEAPSPLPDPADRATLDDSVRLALLVVLEKLTPAERVVFVLHDVFQFSFEAIADIVGRSPVACRQLASRARRRAGTEAQPSRFEVGLAEQHRVAERFIAACAGGDLHALMQVLHTDVAGQVDLGDRPPRRPLTGRLRVARGLLARYSPLSGISLVSQRVNGQAAVLGFRDRHLVAILVLSERDDLITHIHAIGDPRKLAFVASELT